LEAGPLTPGGRNRLSTHPFTHGLQPEEETTMYLYLYLKNLLKNEEGQDLIEYALILVLIVLAAVVFLPDIGVRINGIFEDILDQLNATAG
jgi:Flp pilus assembly pilin Flp